MFLCYHIYLDDVVCSLMPNLVSFYAGKQDACLMGSKYFDNRGFRKFTFLFFNQMLNWFFTLIYSPFVLSIILFSYT